MAVGFVPIQNPSHSAYGMRGIIVVFICFPFLVGKNVFNVTSQISCHSV